MAEYTIQQISNQPPREWSFRDKQDPNKTVNMVTYKVLLSGEGEPVEVNKPSGKVPQVGDVLTGTIETTEFGGKKFKAERKSFTPGGTYQPRDDASIKAQFAIKVAIQFLPLITVKATPDDTELVEQLAKKFYLMVDRVKAVDPATTKVAEPVPDRPGDIRPDGGFGQGELVNEFPDEPIDLNTIPF